MTLSKYSKRHVQFEALEAKNLFAADPLGGAVADLADTAMVADIHADPLEGYPIIGTIDDRLSDGMCDDGLADSPSLTNVSAESDDTVRAFLVAALDPGDAVSGVHGDVTNSLKVKDFTVEQNLVPNLGGEEGEPVNRYMTTDTGEPLHTVAHEAAHVVQQLGGQEGEPVTGTIDDGLADTPNFEQDTDQTLHPAENLSSAQSRVRDADLTNDSPTQVHHIKPHGSAGSWSDYPEFTEPHQLGGQEGEPIFDADDWDWIDNQSVQESLHACDANGQGATRHNVTGFTEVGHIFEQYAAEIGAHNTQWDLLCSK